MYANDAAAERDELSNSAAEFEANDDRFRCILTVSAFLAPEKPGVLKVEWVKEDQMFLSWVHRHRGYADDYAMYLTPADGSVVNPSNRTMKKRIARNLVPGEDAVVVVVGRAQLSGAGGQ